MTASFKKQAMGDYRSGQRDRAWNPSRLNSPHRYAMPSGQEFRAADVALFERPLAALQAKATIPSGVARRFAPGVADPRVGVSGWGSQGPAERRPLRILMR